MDQSSLTALLKQLQGLDPPEEDGELQTSTNDEEADPREVPDAIPQQEDNNSESELDKLLNSLKPLLPDHNHGTIQPNYASRHSYRESYEEESYAVPETFPALESTNDHSGLSGNATDMRKYTFTQALPVLSRLATDPDFLEKLQQLKSGQEAFELSLLDERNRAKADLEKQLKRAQDAAEASGVSYEVERIKKLLASTLNKFDKDALIRWDALARDQQARLEKMGVPCFYVLKGQDAVAQERQRRVMETLVTLLEES